MALQWNNILQKLHTAADAIHKWQTPPAHYRHHRHRRRRLPIPHISSHFLRWFVNRFYTERTHEFGTTDRKSHVPSDTQLLCLFRATIITRAPTGPPSDHEKMWPAEEEDDEEELEPLGASESNKYVCHCGVIFCSGNARQNAPTSAETCL